MNNSIKTGLCQELEMEAQPIGLSYSYETRQIDSSKLELIITDNESLDVINGYVEFGKVKDKELIGLNVSYKKEHWFKSYDTYGQFLDGMEDNRLFIKECVKKIIKIL